METVVQNVWTKSKLLIKGLIIGMLILLLLIPAEFVKDLVREREGRQQEAIAEVSSKWATRQTVTGPVLILPYQKKQSDSVKAVQVKQYAYFLPENLTINATVTPREKHRGIYKVMLYSSLIQLTGNFSPPDLKRLNLSAEDILWSEAVIKLPVTDNKGLNEEIRLQVGDSGFLLAPQTFEDPSIKNALQADLKWTGAESLKPFSFSSSFTLNGSQQILFTPTGKSTTVNVQSAWPHPSFAGDALPQSTDIKKSGFKATWKSASHKRNFPQQWRDGSYSVGDVAYLNTAAREYRGSTTVDVVPALSPNNINNAAFGVDLFVPVNSYQKTLRSVKYAVLVILLTFVSFFLIETNNKRSVHPFQYGLIGIALILFYTLLLSFSEYISFNISYAIASVCTIGLIGWFVKGLLASARLATLLSTLLVLIYVYVFTILQLQDYSLLIGSVGLFITLAIVMRFSRSIQW